MCLDVWEFKGVFGMYLECVDRLGFVLKVVGGDFLYRISRCEIFF